MYWDVVEVKAEPHYCLFVRFKDGLTGRVLLRRDDLTGVLAPLRDEQFFEQVSLITVRLRGLGRLIWRRMHCTLRSPGNLMSCMSRNRRAQRRATAER
jgi:hypothetical protein